MPTSATIAITPGTGQLLDAVSLMVGGQPVVRETMVIADPTIAGNLATVTAGGALNVADAVLEACITANVLAVSLPTGQITTLTPPTAAAIAGAIVANPPTVFSRPAAPTAALWFQAAINISGSGATTIGPAAAGGKTVRIMRMFFVNSSATASTNITIQDSTPTLFSGAFLLLPGGWFAASSAGEPLYTSGVGQSIQLNSSVAVQLSGTVWYTQS